MRDAVRREIGQSTMLFMAAAVADYRPSRPAGQKLKKTAGPMRLELERTVDILGELGGRAGHCLMVGFAAETEAVVANAERKLREKRLDLIVANDVAAPNTGFEVETNAATLIDAQGRHDVPLASKDEVADRILDRALTLQRARRPPPLARQRPATRTRAARPRR
jgi:phosphopantothenoylcysteine decarboxylase/phosphopantothenate--cysteine ligase